MSSSNHLSQNNPRASSKPTAGHNKQLQGASWAPGHTAALRLCFQNKTGVQHVPLRTARALRAADTPGGNTPPLAAWARCRHAVPPEATRSHTPVRCSSNQRDCRFCPLATSTINAQALLLGLANGRKVAGASPDLPARGSPLGVDMGSVMRKLTCARLRRASDASHAKTQTTPAIRSTAMAACCAPI